MENVRTIKETVEVTEAVFGITTRDSTPYIRPHEWLTLKYRLQALVPRTEHGQKFPREGNIPPSYARFWRVKPPWVGGCIVKSGDDLTWLRILAG